MLMMFETQASWFPLTRETFGLQYIEDPQKKKARAQRYAIGYANIVMAEEKSLVRFQRWWRFRIISAPTSPLTSSLHKGQYLSLQACHHHQISLELGHTLMATDELLLN